MNIEEKFMKVIKVIKYEEQFIKVIKVFVAKLLSMCLLSIMSNNSC